MPAGWIVKESEHFLTLNAQHICKNDFLFAYLNQGADTEQHQPLTKVQDKIIHNNESEPQLINLDTEWRTKISYYSHRAR